MLAGFEVHCAVNENRTLAALFETGEMRRTQALATPSPAMDISVPSNFERLLFEVSGRDGDTVRAIYGGYKQSGEAKLPERVKGPLGCAGFEASSVSNADTVSEMQRYLDVTGGLICPHTAVGTYAAERLGASDAATVVLSTAHAAKFPETVLEATGREAPLPARCETVASRAEVFERVPADLSVVKDVISGARLSV